MVYQESFIPTFSTLRISCSDIKPSIDLSQWNPLCLQVSTLLNCMRCLLQQSGASICALLCPILLRPLDPLSTKALLKMHPPWTTNANIWTILRIFATMIVKPMGQRLMCVWLLSNDFNKPDTYAEEELVEAKCQVLLFHASMPRARGRIHQNSAAHRNPGPGQLNPYQTSRTHSNHCMSQPDVYLSQ